MFNKIDTQTYLELGDDYERLKYISGCINTSMTNSNLETFYLVTQENLDELIANTIKYCNKYKVTDVKE